jgi:hypothetical protein
MKKSLINVKYIDKINRNKRVSQSSLSLCIQYVTNQIVFLIFRRMLI